MDKPNQRIRVEVRSRNDFWRRAVPVEWQHQFPDRKLVTDADGLYRIEPAWLEDLGRVAGRCFSTIDVAPQDPGRRRLFRRFVGRS